MRTPQAGKRAGALLLLAAAAAWCAGLPAEAGEVRGLRAAKAAARLHRLETKTATNTVSCRLAGDLRLADAVEKALALNLSLRRARLEQEIAEGRVLMSYSEVLPSLILDGGTVRHDEELGVVRDGVYTPTRFRNRHRAGLRLEQPLFNGRAGPALRTGRLYRFWSETAVREAEEDVRYEVVAAYYRAVLSDHLLRVNLASLETAERRLADTRARRRQGMASNYDELRAEVEVSNFQAQVLQARNEKDVALTALFRLLGVSPGSEVVLADALPLVVESVTFEEALRVALERRPDLVQAEYAVQLQRESVAAVRAGYSPEVSAYLAQNWSRPDPHQSGRDAWGDEWEAGLLVSLPLFDGLDRRGRMVQERARLLQAELALRDLEEQAVSEVRQQVLSLETAEEFARSQSRNLETAREALRLVETGLREGQNTPVEVMDARQALTTASANYYQSLYKHAMARVALQKAMGLLSAGRLPDGAVLRE